MNDANPPPARREPWPSWKQTAIMLVGGLVLGFSGCFGFLLSFNMNASSDFEFGNVLGAIAFGLGLLAFLVGIVMLLMKVARLLLASGSRPPSPPGQPGPPGPPSQPSQPSQSGQSGQSS